MSTAIATTWEQRWADLGNVPSSRIRMIPAPGTATIEDAVRIQDQERRIFELIDGTLVEKAMGWQESLLAGVLVHWLHIFLDEKKLGVVTGPNGLARLFGDTVRGPDVAFYTWARLTGGRLPTEPIPDLVPNFVIEVLSVSNTYTEMSRKRREYFHAGVERMWFVDPRRRIVAVYRSANDLSVMNEGDDLNGETVLPGWTINTGKLFAKLDKHDEIGNVANAH